MAWNVTNQNLSMVEGDFGVAIPFDIIFENDETTLGQQDSIKFVIKTSVNGEEILVKNYDGFEDNTFDLVLTEAESAKLPVGNYAYRLDWYQNGSFMCNIIPVAQFKVVDKA